MEQLRREFGPKGFQFLTVYTREPHPGEHYSHHTSYDQKMRYASDCQREEGIVMPVVVDSLDGEAHRAYGSMPNMVYVVSRAGRIVYRSQWTLYSEIREVCEDLVRMDAARERGERVRLVYSERISMREAYEKAHRRVFERAGPKAGRDYQQVFGGG